MGKLFLVFSSLSMIGCTSAKWQQKNFEPKGGVIQIEREWQRDDALEKMKEHCAPQAYKIISSDIDSRTNGIMANGAFLVPMRKEYESITFKCVDLP